MEEQSQHCEPLAFAIGSISAPEHYALESAISSTAAAATESKDRTALILDDHLKSLCALQLRHLERLADYDYATATGLDTDE